MVQTCPHLANFTGTLMHSIESTSTARKEPLISGPKCKICPFFIVPLITVPARIMLLYKLKIFEIKNYACISWLFLSSLVEVNRLKKLMSRSRFLPVTLEVKNIGITSYVEVILEKSTAFSIYLITLGAFSGYSYLSVFFILITVSI